MSNVSGIEVNKVFKVNETSRLDYYYIRTQLSFDELVTSGGDRYYFFNKDNILGPQAKVYNPNYTGYIRIRDNVVIGDVVAYASPEFKDGGNFYFQIGGIDESLSFSETWGGPTGNQPGDIYSDQLDDAQICHFGKSPDPASPLLIVYVYNDSGDDLQLKGTIHVELKIYPKF